MKSTRTLKAAGLVLIAVVLGMLTVQGSYALWNTSTGANLGTVQAASFQVDLADAVTGQHTNMTTANGTAATLALTTMPAGVIIPGDSTSATYAGVQVTNLSDAGGDFTIRATTSAPVVRTGSSLAGSLVIKVVTATTLAQCSQADTFKNAVPNAPAAVDISKGATGAFCFQITLDASMPANLSGQTAQIAIPITVNQL